MSRAAYEQARLSHRKGTTPLTSYFSWTIEGELPNAVAVFAIAGLASLPGFQPTQRRKKNQFSANIGSGISKVEWNTKASLHRISFT